MTIARRELKVNVMGQANADGLTSIEGILFQLVQSLREKTDSG